MAKTLPVLLIKDFVILPQETMKVEPSNNLSIEILTLSEKLYQNEILVLSPKDSLEENPSVEDLPKIGIISKIKNKIELPNHHIRVTLEGIKRIKIEKYFNLEKNSEILGCQYFYLEEQLGKEADQESYKKELKKVLKKYITLNSNVSNEILNEIDFLSFSQFIDKLTCVLPLDSKQKEAYVEERNVMARAKKLLEDFILELKIVKLDQQVISSLEEGLNQSQKEFVLNEKLKVIQKELGEENKKSKEIEEYFHLLDSFDLSLRTKKKIQNEIKKYEVMSENSPDISFVRNYLELIFSLPWNEETVECEDLKMIEKALNKTHYGLKNIKMRILEYVAMKKRNPLLQAPILCLVGPPGVGKSTIAYSIANALHREFYKISVGGLNDSSELTGHRRTYLGSAPGKIITALQKCGSKNPLILIDEVDKMVKDYKGDPASVLLDILDPNLNQTFTDSYLEEPFDLSHVLFFLTANRADEIPNELKDRLEIIEISSYSTQEKMSLAEDYILPLLHLDYHIREEEVKISKEALEYLILNYTAEAGVRDLKRKLEEVYRKSILDSEKNKKSLEITLEVKDIKRILEEKVTLQDYEPKEKSCGLVKALAVTDLGGIPIPIEAVCFQGSGKIYWTGSLGETMKESIEVVMSFLKANAPSFEIPFEWFQTKDFHIHALDASTKKDGPSAGLAITTALISLMKKIEISPLIAMSGEMTLRGEILPVGGVKEKVIGAYNRGLKKIYLPEANKVDVKHISKEVKEGIAICYVKDYAEIYKDLF